MYLFCRYLTIYVNTCSVELGFAPSKTWICEMQYNLESVICSVIHDIEPGPGVVVSYQRKAPPPTPVTRRTVGRALSQNRRWRPWPSSCASAVSRSRPTSQSTPTPRCSSTPTPTNTPWFLTSTVWCVHLHVLWCGCKCVCCWLGDALRKQINTSAPLSCHDPGVTMR